MYKTKALKKFVVRLATLGKLNCRPSGKIGWVLLCSLLTFKDLSANGALAKQKADLLQLLKTEFELTSEQMQKIEAIFSKAPFLSQGNPQSSIHPISEAQCQEKWKSPALQKRLVSDRSNECKTKYMMPIGPEGQKPTYCVDQFEFPGIPCQYPLIWVTTKEAAQICAAMDKRLCDADEWENACGGAFPPRDVPPRPGESFNDWHSRQRKELNTGRKIASVPAGVKCATASTKTNECNTALAEGKGIWEKCGSNTYPAGSFPECSVKYDVFDFQGNAAEHMNLPMTEDQRGKNGGTGYAEMKGSWFIFSTFKAHPDDCYWRAPYWHGTPVMDDHSHHNYHLGFRCCKDIR